MQLPRFLTYFLSKSHSSIGDGGDFDRKIHAALEELSSLSPSCITLMQITISLTRNVVLKDGKICDLCAIQLDLQQIICINLMLCGNIEAMLTFKNAGRKRQERMDLT